MPAKRKDNVEDRRSEPWRHRLPQSEMDRAVKAYPNTQLAKFYLRASDARDAADAIEGAGGNVLYGGDRVVATAYGRAVDAIGNRVAQRHFNATMSGPGVPDTSVPPQIGPRMPASARLAVSRTYQEAVARTSPLIGALKAKRAVDRERKAEAAGAATAAGAGRFAEPKLRNSAKVEREVTVREKGGETYRRRQKVLADDKLSRSGKSKGKAR